MEGGKLKQSQLAGERSEAKEGERSIPNCKTAYQISVIENKND